MAFTCSQQANPESPHNLFLFPIALPPGHILSQAAFIQSNHELAGLLIGLYLLLEVIPACWLAFGCCNVFYSLPQNVTEQSIMYGRSCHTKAFSWLPLIIIRV